MLFLLWTFIDIVGRSDKMLAKFEKRAYAGSERVWVGKYRNLHNIAHWHMEHELIACAEGSAKVMLDDTTYRLARISVYSAKAAVYIPLKPTRTACCMSACLMRISALLSHRYISPLRRFFWTDTGFCKRCLICGTSFPTDSFFLKQKPTP